MENKNTKRGTVLRKIILISGCILVAVCYFVAALFVINNVIPQEWQNKKETLAVQNTVLDASLETSTESELLEPFYEIQQNQQEKKDYAITEKQNNADNKNIVNGDSKTVKSASTIQQTNISKTVVSDVTEVVKAAMPSVVAITNQYSKYDFWAEQVIKEEANGSGIIISQKDDELLIVTNYHVIESASDLYVKFIDDKEAVAYVKGTDSGSDLAVISVSINEIDEDTLSAIAIAALGNSDELEVGEPAIAIGNSLGYGQSVTTGVISALDRQVYLEDDEETGKNNEYLIQTDAAINPGNSGGALLNVKGEVIGINSSKIADYVIEGMGYAIPITNAKPIIDELSLKETRKKVAEDDRGFLGISGIDVSADVMENYKIPEGVYIVEVLEGTAAEKHGLFKGDIIVEIEGEKVTTMTTIQNMMDFYSAGTTMEMIIMRQEKGEYKKYKVNVVLGKK